MIIIAIGVERFADPLAQASVPEAIPAKALFDVLDSTIDLNVVPHSSEIEAFSLDGLVHVGVVFWEDFHDIGLSVKWQVTGWIRRS